MKTELGNMKAKLLTVDQQLQKQTTRNIKIEGQSRRSNVKFFNVKETEATDNSYETEKVLKQLLMNELKMTEEVVDKLQFERVHCIPTKRSSKTPIDKPRPIIAKLSFYKDKTSIFQHVKNINSELKIGVADDYPKEIDEMRKALLPVLKNAKKHKIPAAFNVDKLIVNGQIITDLKLRSSRFTLKFCLHKIHCL